MAATRYLVEGDRLDVLIGQVKRMGRRVTVLKAEKVRKGGLAGMFSKEHFEVLVEVEGVGEPPEQFQNATRAPRKNHSTLSEMADEAGIYRQKKQPAKTSKKKPTPPPEEKPETKKDEGLQDLLDEARSQLNSNTEAAAAQLEAQLAQMERSSAADLLNDTPATPPPAAQPRANANVLDARLQGVAAPGASARQTRQVAPPIDPTALVDMQAASELGFSYDILQGIPLSENNQMTLDNLLHALPAPVELTEKPGATIVVIGSVPNALSIVETAQRLAGRLGDNAYCVLGGPKTTLPGEALRARSAEELKETMASHEGMTCVLALADSLIEVHRRTMAKLISVIYVDQTWAVVDARTDIEKIKTWIKGLPDAIRPDALAVQRIWESTQPGSLFEVGIPIGMFDGVPARSEAWKMLLEDIFSSQPQPQG